jgi:purine-cytosine permease-like protein
MFADYPRYTANPRASAVAVFAGLAATSLWLMPLGAVAAQAAHSSDPGGMMAAVGLGRSGALLLAGAAVTTNFVNIYMSALAWKSLVPRVGDTGVVWSIGLIGTTLGAIPGVWIEQYTNFMILLAGTLIPIGGILIAHFYVTDRSSLSASDVAALYDENGPARGLSHAGIAAWSAGAVTFLLVGRAVGGTLPSLAVSVATYSGLTALSRRGGRTRDPAATLGAPGTGTRRPRS